MCEATLRTVESPHWGWLYGATLPPLAALAAVEAAAPPNVLRTVLDYALALAALAGLALWTRANRAMFDLQNWCECAPRTITVRVIESRRSATPGRPEPLEPTPAFAAAEYELTDR